MSLAMLTQLTQAILARNFVASEQLESWMEAGDLEFTSKVLNPDCVRICRLRYDAVIVVERFAREPQELVALVSAWLMDHDRDREDTGLPAPRVEIDVNDNRTADIEINVPFYEYVDLVADDQGPVEFKGTRWAIKPVEIDDASIVGVGDNPTLPTDKPYVRED